MSEIFARHRRNIQRPPRSRTKVRRTTYQGSATVCLWYMVLLFAPRNAGTTSCHSSIPGEPYLFLPSVIRSGFKSRFEKFRFSIPPELTRSASSLENSLTAPSSFRIYFMVFQSDRPERFFLNDPNVSRKNSDARSPSFSFGSSTMKKLLCSIAALVMLAGQEIGRAHV